ncbi:MAG: hypothetical protein HN833_04380 [Elusimicrobiaceae bacterium]|jgi:hypothetical protein|nr:hypothetical protein [Elusimicrobiaceae bacterium]MBT3954640.1 hypothetical protein [Elusimicrobiaceae bacterium]MBT4007948.1 hypothetical protein [Elusimicrobiaceae bacterium]MBT4403301.1 hypothetical protein [Elusimicrobiaceae bacterium]MBT4439962.1 hypothetical protein [Elusimicrobiaceae bacterium]
MKTELKKIKVSSIIFSIYPIALFAIAFVFSIGQGIIEKQFGYTSLNESWFIFTTARIVVFVVAFLLASMVSALIYNLLCRFGLKGISIECKDKKEGV